MRTRTTLATAALLAVGALLSCPVQPTGQAQPAKDGIMPAGVPVTVDSFPRVVQAPPANLLLATTDQMLLVRRAAEAAGPTGPFAITPIYTVGQIGHPGHTFVFVEDANQEGIQLQVFAFGVGISPGRVHSRGSTPEGCTISFVDGHAIFWTYAEGDRIGYEIANAAGPDVGPDAKQLIAWIGGPIPPGATP